MSRRRAMVVLVLTVVLTISLVGTSVAIGVDRGVLDAESVQSNSADAELPEVIHEEIVVETLQEELKQRDTLPFEIPAEQIVRAAVTVSFVQTQVDTNVDRSVGFLRGDVDSFHLSVEIRPVFEQLINSIADFVIELDPAEIGFDRMDVLAQNESTFNSVKADYVNASRDALLEELDDDLEHIAPPDPLEVTYRAYGMVGVDALSTDMNYRTYMNQLERNQGELAEETGTYMVLDADGGLPANIDLVDEPPTAIERVQPITSTLWWLAIGLLILAVGLVAAIARTAPDRPLVLGCVAGACLVTGFLGFGLALGLPHVVESMFYGFNPTIAGSLRQVTAGLLDTLRQISMLWLLVGSLLGLGAVLDFDVN